MARAKILEQGSLLCRSILSVMFIVFGLNGFFSFIAVPEFHPFMSLLVSSGYIYVVKLVEVIGGMLLFTRVSRLGLLLLTPIVVNIAAYHYFLDSRNSAIVFVLITPLLYLVIIDYRQWLAFLISAENVKTETSSKFL